MQKLENRYNSYEPTRLINQELSNIEVQDFVLVNKYDSYFLFKIKGNLVDGFAPVIIYGVSKTFKSIKKHTTKSILKELNDSNYVCNLGNVPISHIKGLINQDFPEFII